MTKAKKGLIITLFAAMMVFAFGATSVFAASYDVDWAPDYKTAEVSSDGTVIGTLNAAWAFDSTGLTTATVTYNGSTVGSAYFYDFTGATINLGDNWSKTEYDKLPNQTPSIIMVKPTGATGEATATVTSKTFRSWNAAYEVDKSVESGDAPVDVALTRDSYWASFDEGTDVNPAKFGDVQTKTVNVSAATASATWQEMVEGVAKDVTNGTTYQPKYDGTAHTLFAKAKKNYTVSYEKYSATAGEWQATDAVSYKDVDGEAVQYRAVYTPTKVGANYTYAYLTVTVKPITSAPKYFWTTANGTAPADKTADYEVTEAQAANPKAFVEFKNKLEDKTINVEELSQVFDELYTIEVKKNAISENQQTWTIKPVDDFATAVKASKKAHKQLFANYDDNYLELSTQEGMKRNDVSVLVVGGPALQDDTLDITYAPTKVTYKAKKIKKASKSFTVESVTKSGKAVAYTLKTSSKKITINSETGKVTVKKGLKKGTYKITVIARTADGDGYKAAQDKATITIKVKK